MNAPRPAADESLLTYTNIVYALQALAVIIAFASARSVVRNFIFSLPSIIAVIMSYARQAAARGTFLESHFRWQIHTFWVALVCAVALWVVTFPLKFLLIGFPLFYLGLALLAIWIIYRIARGWLALRDRRPV
jgi:uncharacterized membrane protein